MNALEAYGKYEMEYSDLAVHLPFLRQNAHGRVLEIGVRDGISTAALLVGLATHGGHLYSVDIEDRSHLYVDSRWTFVRADSRWEHRRIFEAMGKEDDHFRIDLLFIDGDHSYDGCMCDLTTYGPWADMIAVHDTNSEFTGVWESVISYYRSPFNGPFRRAEFVTASHGLGVLYR